MTSIAQFRGIIPALHTPLDEEGRVNIKVLPGWLRWFKAAGCGGFFVGGSSGECFMQTIEERKTMAEAVVKEMGSELPVVVHVGAMDQRAAVELAQHAARIGAAGISAVVPFYFPFSPEHVRQYFQALADASGLPLICYVFSGSASVHFTPEMFAEKIGTIRGLYGIKYTAADVFQMQTIQLLSGGRLRTYGGYDEIALSYLVMGVEGLIGSNYNFMPEPFIALYRAFQQGDLRAAMQCQAALTSALSKLGKIQPVERGKAGCRARGIDLGPTRKPLAWPDEQALEVIKNVLAELRLSAVDMSTWDGGTAA